MSLLYGLLVLLAPLYIWRFELVGLPTNFLMVYSGFVLLCGFGFILYKKELRKYYQAVLQLPKVLIILISLFVVASIVSLFVNGVDLPKLAQWLVLYILPIGLGSQLYYFVQTEVVKKSFIVNVLYLFLCIVGVVAVAQYFFLIGLPTDFWGNANEPKRAIGVFSHPNGFALFITPLLAYLLPHVKAKLESVWNNFWQKDLLFVLAWLLGGIGLLLSLSRGGWLGLLVAGIIFVVFSSSKKMIFAYAAATIIIAGILFSIPNFRYRILLPFHGEKSTVARFSLWETGSKMIKDSPVVGQGINGFNYNWDRFNTDPGLEHYNFPHNFILNTWIDLGLLGLLSWLGIMAWALWYGLTNKIKPYAFGLALFCIALLAHGLIDIPYFKNDLAILFWLIFALSL